MGKAIAILGECLGGSQLGLDPNMDNFYPADEDFLIKEKNDKEDGSDRDLVKELVTKYYAAYVILYFYFLGSLGIRKKQVYLRVYCTSCNLNTICYSKKTT